MLFLRLHSYETAKKYFYHFIYYIIIQNSTTTWVQTWQLHFFGNVTKVEKFETKRY